MHDRDVLELTRQGTIIYMPKNDTIARTHTHVEIAQFAHDIHMGMTSYFNPMSYNSND